MDSLRPIDTLFLLFLCMSVAGIFTFFALEVFKSMQINLWERFYYLSILSKDCGSKLQDSPTFSRKLWTMAAAVSCFIIAYIIVKSTESVFSAGHNVPAPAQK